jgi:squalene cyclase
MNSEQFSFVEHPATCGHCGKEVTVPMCPYCLHEEKSISVQLHEAKTLLAKTNLELQQFKDAYNRRLEFARAHLQDSAKKVKEAYDADE